MDLIYLLAVTIGSLVIVPGAVVGWKRDWFESPKRKAAREAEQQAREQAKAVADAILGEAETRDRSGNVLTPKQPGLVARTTVLEEAVRTLVNQETRIKKLEDAVGILNPTVASLLTASHERAATADAAAQALRLVNERDTIDGD